MGVLNPRAPGVVWGPGAADVRARPAALAVPAAAERYGRGKRANSTVTRPPITISEKARRPRSELSSVSHHGAPQPARLCGSACPRRHRRHRPDSYTGPGRTARPAPRSPCRGLLELRQLTSVAGATSWPSPPCLLRSHVDREPASNQRLVGNTEVPANAEVLTDPDLCWPACCAIHQKPVRQFTRGGCRLAPRDAEPSWTLTNPEERDAILGVLDDSSNWLVELRGALARDHRDRSG